MNERQLLEKHKRDKGFEHALKLIADVQGWSFDFGTLSNNQEGWYVANTAILAYERGAMMNMIYKPMAVDRIFWEIAGLPVKNADSLSVRNRRVWTVMPSSYSESLGHNVSCVDELASLTFEWTREWRDRHLKDLSISSMLDQLGDLTQSSGTYRALAVCLLVLQNDFDAAHALCLKHSYSQDDDGGLSFKGADESHLTFYDRAREWMIKARSNLC